MFESEVAILKKSSWPKCDALAGTLAKHGRLALPALQEALSSRTHHVRSACLREIANLDSDLGKTCAKKLLKDRAYEVRETAARILEVPIPD